MNTKIITFLLAALLLSTLCLAESVKFYVYTDNGARENHYTPSGFFGDYNDIKLNAAWKEGRHSGTTCMKFKYTAKNSLNQGYAGVYWQHPANNWGKRKGGFNLSGKTKLIFWARGEKGGEIIKRFGVGGIKDIYPDSSFTEIGPIELTTDWKEYTIDLTGKDLSYINGGFFCIATVDSNQTGCIFYLDDIVYE